MKAFLSEGPNVATADKMKAVPFERMKWYLLIVGIILMTLSSILGCVSIARNLDTKHPSEKVPIRILSIQIDQEQREELFSQLRKFSEKHHLEFRLSFYENEKVFFVEMYGKRLEILALSKLVATKNLDMLD